MKPVVVKCLVSLSVICFLLGLCFPFLNNPLVFDDEYFFLGGAPARFFSEGISFSPRWWVYETLAATFIWLGNGLPWFRIGNLAVHICTAFAIFFFIKSLLSDIDSRDKRYLSIEMVAFLSAFAFAIHPVMILTQGYLIQRTILCATLFGVLGLWAFWEGLAGKRWALWVSCLCLLLSMYAKEHAVMFPALCFFLWVLRQRSGLHTAFSRKEIISVLVVQCVLALCVVLWSKGVIGRSFELMTEEVLSDETFQPDGSLYVLSVLNQMGLFFKYLSTLTLPQASNMALDLRVPFPLAYGVWWLWVGLSAFIVYGACSFLLLSRGKNKGLLGFALLFPWVLFATELVSVRLQEPFVLYRSYLWAPGLMIVLALGLRCMKRFYVLALLPLFAIYLVGLSYDRLVTLSSPYFVWSESAEYLETQGDRPGIFGGYRIYYNLGNASYQIGMVDLALKSFDRAIELKPAYGYAYHQRGVVFLEQRQWEKSRVEFEKAISLLPGYAKSYLGIAEALRGLEQPEKAQLYLEQGCRKGAQVVCEQARLHAPLVLTVPGV